MKRKVMSTVVLSGLLIATSGIALAGADQAQAEQAIAAAEASRKQADSVKGEWRDTGKMIKQAEKAAKEGKFDDAVKLANKAKRQGELGYEQAISQQKLVMPSYLR